MEADRSAYSEPVPGQRLGKYEILRRLGEGGMATIFLARSGGPGGFEKPVALKLLRPEYARHQEVSDLLIREARVAAQLHHPNIVQVFDLGRIGNDYFMAMEWVEGASLLRLMVEAARSRRTLPMSVSVFIAQQVAEALAYLQAGPVLGGATSVLVHRDISPSNVLLSSSGAVKLTDFGVVKVLDAPPVTRIGVVKGKYAYMSPEQLRGDPLDHRSDIFSLGVVLYEMLAGRRLFSRKTLAATVAAAHAARVRPPSEHNPSVPPELDEVVLKALAKSPDDRYSDAERVVQDLLPFTSMTSRATLSQLVRALSGEGGSALGDGSAALSSARLIEAEEDLPQTHMQDFVDLEAEAQADDRLAEPTIGYADAADEAIALPSVTVMREVSPPIILSDQAIHDPNVSSTGFGMALILVGVTLAGIAVFWWLVLG